MHITLPDRIEGLSAIWSTAKYNFARWDELPDLDWQVEYRAALSRIIAVEGDDNGAACYDEYARFVALLRDGHSYIVEPEELRLPYRLAFGTSHRWGRHIVYSVPKGCGVPPLSEILAVNGRPLPDYLREKTFPYMWHEREDAKFFNGQLGYEIMRREGDIITIDTDGGSFTVKNHTSDETDAPPDTRNPVYDDVASFARSDGYSLRVTEDGIGVFNIWSCKDRTLRDALYSNIAKYRNCKGFLIDLRDNDGGSGLVVQPLAQLFFKGDVFEGTSYSPQYVANLAAMAQYRYPANHYDGISGEEASIIRKISEHQYYRMIEERFHIEDCPAFLPQPVVVLSSCRTASAAESLLSMLKYQNRATIVGESSYGSTGQPIFGDLPGGGQFAICTMKCTDSIGFDYNNVGIPADIEVEVSRDDVMLGYDRVFERGCEILRESVV